MMSEWNRPERPRQSAGRNPLAEKRNQLLQYDPCVQPDPGLVHMNRIIEQIGILRVKLTHIDEEVFIRGSKVLKDPILKVGHAAYMSVGKYSECDVQIVMQVLLTRKVEHHAVIG